MRSYLFLIAVLSDFIMMLTHELGCRILQGELKLQQHYSFLSCKIVFFWRNRQERNVFSCRHLRKMKYFWISNRRESTTRRFGTDTAPDRTRRVCSAFLQQ